MGELIKRAILSVIMLPIVLLFALLFGGLAPGTYFIYAIIVIILIVFICKPFYRATKIKKAKDLLIYEDYELVIDGITIDKNYLDPHGLSARKYYVTKINKYSMVIYLNTYK